MKDKPDSFKVVDNTGKNIATDFLTQDAAERYIVFQKSFWVDTIPVPDPGPDKPEEPGTPPKPGEVDEDGIKILAPPKAGGIIIKDFDYKRSSHNTGTRDTFSKIIGPPMNIGFYGYFKTSLTKASEEYSFKIHGGTHSGDGESNLTKQGRCIAIGLQQDGKPSFKIEYPYHNQTPDFSDKVEFPDPKFKSVGNIKDKQIGIAGFAIVDKTQNKACYELWVDTEPFKDGKPQNKWRLLYTVENKPGTFVKDLYTDNQGIKFGGKGLFYLRVDTVTYKTNTYGFKMYEIAALPPAPAPVPTSTSAPREPPRDLIESFGT